MKENTMPQAKCGTVVACLFVLTAGQLFLLRGALAAAGAHIASWKIRAISA